MNRSTLQEDWSSRLALPLSVLLSSLALVVAFWGLFQLDLSLARLIQSIDHPWFEFVGHVGNRVGNGLFLVGISGAMLAIGLVLKRPVFRLAGLESLVAHAAAALIVQVLKHLIGRPRPRMTHSNGFQFGPSWDSGLDSFPSGHTMASFAVAAVLAKHFPWAAWILYSTAGLVAAGRVIHGSHFPSDVIAGAGLGLLVGYAVANPIREWRRSLFMAMTVLAPYLIGVFALLWTVCHVPSDEQTNTVTMAAGIVAIAVGSGSRFSRTARGTNRLSSSWVPSRFGTNGLIGGGLALTTGSMLVMGLALMLILAQWLAHDPVTSAKDSPPDLTLPPSPGYRGLIAEALFAAALIVAVLAIQGLKGILPIL